MRLARGGRHIAALIGYTNAGKSTVMQRLTGADVLVRDQLFATIDTTTRRLNGNGHVNSGSGHDVLLIDTVGFIRKLPDHLKTSFKATLGDTAQAELYLHVVDVSHPPGRSRRTWPTPRCVPSRTRVSRPSTCSTRSIASRQSCWRDCGRAFPKQS